MVNARAAYIKLWGAGGGGSTNGGTGGFVAGLIALPAADYYVQVGSPGVNSAPGGGGESGTGGTTGAGPGGGGSNYLISSATLSQNITGPNATDVDYVAGVAKANGSGLAIVEY